MSAVVLLHADQTQVFLDHETEKRAINVAFYVTMSEHEHEWSQSDSKAMAKFVLWAHQRLTAIQQVANRNFHLAHEPVPYRTTNQRSEQ